MLDVKTIGRIRREHLGKGVPIEQISRELRVSRNTVRKVVRSGETSFRYERKVQPMPKLGACVRAPGVSTPQVPWSVDSSRMRTARRSMRAGSTSVGGKEVLEAGYFLGPHTRS